MCRCCSFESLACRRRTLKCSGSLLIAFGFVFFIGGIAVGILPEVYDELPDVYSTYIFYAFLVPVTGIAAFVTGMGAIHMGQIMSDDDCSARGLSILALLTILCSLASVGVPAWPLYEEGYFLEIPPEAQAMANTTLQPSATTFLTSLPPAMTTMDEADSNATAMATDGTNTTDMGSATTSATDASAVTVTATDAAMSMNTTDNPMPAANATNAVDTENITMASGGNSQTETAPSTANTVSTVYMTNTINSTTPADVTRVPLPYELWFDVIVPFGIICVFALIFVLCALLVCSIGCCCSDYSEIVDDAELYKT